MSITHAKVATDPQVPLLNDADWNADHVGAPPLAEVLAAGNLVGGTPIRSADGAGGYGASLSITDGGGAGGGGIGLTSGDSTDNIHYGAAVGVNRADDTQHGWAVVYTDNSGGPGTLIGDGSGKVTYSITANVPPVSTGSIVLLSDAITAITDLRTTVNATLAALKAAGLMVPD